jgi:hypothetical protein
MLVNNILVAGASITASPWLTWKDFLEIESNLPVRNLSVKGIGNEFMVVSILKNSELITPGTLVIVMLTNVDKFDWYVEGNTYCELTQQKHQPIPISKNSGFWCTGSWFPETKSIFKDKFYSLDYFCSKTIQQILLLQTVCQEKNCTLQILFDSPVWNFTEQDINAIGANKLTIKDAKQDLLKLPLTQIWASQINQDIKNARGLIGYCWDHNLDWYNSHYRGHPPSSSHWEYYSTVVKSALEPWIKFNDCKKIIEPKIKKFTEVWNQY